MAAQACRHKPESGVHCMAGPWRTRAWGTGTRRLGLEQGLKRSGLKLALQSKEQTVCCRNDGVGKGKRERERETRSGNMSKNAAQNSVGRQLAASRQLEPRPDSLIAGPCVIHPIRNPIICLQIKTCTGTRESCVCPQTSLSFLRLLSEAIATNTQKNIFFSQ